VTKTIAIEFLCRVDEFTVTQLLDIIKQQMQDGVEKIILLISSSGGNVFYGLSVYNFLKGMPIEVITHNFGSVDSSAGVIYCAGSKRYSSPDARFLIHPLTWTYSDTTTLYEEQMEENLKSFRIDSENVVGVLVTATGKKEEEIVQDMKNRKHLNPDQAKNYGLVHEIKENLIEKGTAIFKIKCHP
jgi:ATP-dependent protease ClpP protease subunit